MKIHHIQGYIQSIYLVEYSDKLLLLDGCCRADITRLKTFIENDLKRSMHELKLVVVTHMHPDHAGGAHQLRALTACKIASTRRIDHWYAGFMGTMMFFTDLLLTLFVAFRMGRPIRNVWYPRKLISDVQVRDGDTLPGFDDWQVWETPGHTDRDLSVLHTATQQIYVGDVILKIKGKYISPFPIFHPNQYLAVLKRFQQHALENFLLAHGGKVKISATELQQLIERAPKKPNTHLRFLRRSASRYISKR